MTTREFSLEFDIQYDNISSKSAPGLDLYEKSVYLTRAQLELVKSRFDPKGNKYQKGFEQTSKRGIDLEELVKTINSMDKETNLFHAISDNSQFFKIPSDVFLIIQEQVVSYDPRLCGNSTTEPKGFGPISVDGGPIWKGWYNFEVKPITHDEYNIQKENPFKKPDKKTVWRLSYNYAPSGSTKRDIELISPYELNVYRARYVKYPNPIILTDLSSGEFAGEGLSIDGFTSEMTCELNQEIHREIIDRAVELALVDYKPEQSLQLKTQMNLRDE